MSDTYQITIKISNSIVNGGAIPHAFVSITGLGINTPVNFGYYPQETGVYGPGTVRDDSYSHNGGPHPYDRTVTFDVSAGQAYAALSFMENVANNPGMYVLIGADDRNNIVLADGYQCTGFARDVVLAASIDIGNFGGGAYPGSLGLLTFLDSNQVQPGLSTPTAQNFSDRIRGIYAGSKKFDVSYRTPNSAIPPSSTGGNVIDADVNLVAPTDLTTTRNSANYITDNGAGSNSVTVGTGGTLSDVLLLQNNAGNNITVADILACNPNITNVNQISAGQTIYVPQKQANGTITYPFANGVSINSNVATGEYHITAPNAQGGINTYSKEINGATTTLYNSDATTGAQNWNVSTSGGGVTDITQFANGQVTSVQYNPNGINGGYTLDATPSNIQQYLQQQTLSLPSSGLTAEQQAWQSSYQALNDAIANDPNATVSVDPDGSININANNSTYGLTEGAAYQYAVNSSGQPIGISILSGPGAGQTFTYSSDANLVITDTQATQITQQMLSNLNNTGNPIDTTGSLIPAGFDGVLHATVVATGSITTIAEITFEVNTSGVTTTYYYPGTGDIVQTVDTQVNGQNVNVSFTYNQDGTRTAHVNSINKLPPLNQAAADAVFDQTTPSKLVARDFAGTDIEVTVSNNDAAHPSGLQVLANTLGAAGTTITNYAPPLIDALSIIKAIKSGQPLPIVASGLQLANDLYPVKYDGGKLISGNHSLAGMGAIANGALSVLSLKAALARGDDLGAMTARLQILNYSASAYTNLAQAAGFEMGAVGTGVSKGFSDVVGGKVLPFLGIVNALENDDPVGALTSALALINPATAPIALAYAVLKMIDDLFKPGPIEQWGAANAQWNHLVTAVSAAGSIVEGQAMSLSVDTGQTEINPDTGMLTAIYEQVPIPQDQLFGGRKNAKDFYDAMVAYLNEQITRANQANPSFQLGLVANRLPSITFRDYSGFSLTDIDPVTGQQKNADIRYDRSGHLLFQYAGRDVPVNFANYFLQVAQARGAIAPQWEADTAAMQTQAGDPMAGLTEVERAGRQDKLASPLATDVQTQIFRPVALDLSGNGQLDVGNTTRVDFNVDDSGYLKTTDWLTTTLDPVTGVTQTLDGYLALDRNYNGMIDSGTELFNNGSVDIGLRGLKGMQWVDANYDGKITSVDPVWAEIRVWQDANGDGLSFTDLNGNGQYDFGESELKTLDELGITELDYGMGTFTQIGQIKQMASPDGVADTFGARMSTVRGGILVETTDGKSTVVVTQVDDLSAVEANKDGISAREDSTHLITKAELLKNDSLGGISGANPVAGQYLDIVAVSAIPGETHGSVVLDPSGNIIFTPDANYFGKASFNYTLQASTGQTATATVEVTVNNVNDAPVITRIDPLLAPIYGYDRKLIKNAYDGDPAVYGKGAPHYQPYTGFDYVTGTNGLHDTPLEWYDPDPNAGRLIVTDPDGETNFTFDVSRQSVGGQGVVDANGNFSYVNWIRPNVPGTEPDIVNDSGRNTTYGYTTQPDPFTVTVTDGGGLSASQTINAVHTGDFTGDLGAPKKPISIDLGGDGFGFTDVNDSAIFFDVNGDGFKHRTSWPKADDGLLAFDANGNGLVDDGSEISFSRFLSGAQTDLQGLKAFDSNNDGLFSALDDKWNQFGVWQDANQNGITDAGEFKRLDEMSIAAISLASDGQFSVVNGQTVNGVGTIARMDGSTLAMADVTLKYSDEILLTNPDGTTTVVTKPAFAPSGEVINGTSGKDLLLGNNGNTVINGLEGDDVVVASIGNDVIDGGTGNDLLYGAEGDDLIGGGVGDDVIFGGLGNDFIGGGDGHDAIMGEQGNDIIFGGAGNDFVSAGEGNDVVAAGLGDDQVLGEGGNDALFGEEGNDQLAGMDGYDRLNGGLGDDTLDGGAQDDVLFGGGGNDTLVGGVGSDSMEGGIGNDNYEVDSAADVVIEVADAGIDSVQSSVSYTLSDNVENLTLTGTAAIDATGNALDNIITGNSGTNVLDGGAGADTLIGGQDNDTLLGGAGNDRYVFNLGDGADTIVDASGSDTLFMGSNLTEANLEGFRVGDDMLINVLGTTDAITLTNWFVQGQGVSRIEFADGSFLDPVGIEGLLNRPPVANPDAVTVFEDGGVVNIPTSTLLVNDTDQNTNDIITVTAVGMSAVGASVTLANGQVQYDIGNSFQELGAGQTITDTFSYTISDRKGATDSSVVNVTITGVNDAPVTTADDATALQEDVVVTASGNVLANDADIDQGTILQVANAGTYQGNFGSLVLNADGSYSYALDNGSLAVQSLAQGQVVTENFAYQATDGFVSTPSTLTVTITGTNDVPAVTADTAAVQEDITLQTTGNVLANDSDVDQDTMLQVANAGVFTGQYGELTLQADGSYTYALANSSLAVQSLEQGQVVTETFSYAATDGITATPSILTVSITGTNDAPVVVADTAVVQEDLSITATGNVLTNDSDVDQGTVLTVANAGVFAGSFGSLVLNADGNYSYTLDNSSLAVQSLAEGQVVTETFHYEASDGITSTPSTLTVSITGTNDAPVTTVDTAAVQEDVTLAATGNVLANDSDVDQGTVLTVENAGVFVGQYGQLSLAVDGSYTYVLDNASLAVQSLAEGQVVTESFAYAAFDGLTSTSSTLTVSITGTNDAPVTTIDTAAVQEDLSISAKGNVLANDTDVDQGTVLTVANAGVFAGQYGKLTLAANGDYTYALDNTSHGVQSLAAGQVVTETFAYQATDGLVATPSTLTVTITGTNDAPVVAAAIVDQSTNEDALFSFTVPADTFTDIDQGDVLSYQATLSDGTALPSWLSFDAVTRTFSGVPSNWDVGVLNVSVTATDTGVLTATDTFALDVQNVNDAPVVANHLADQHIEEDKCFSIVVPANTFDDWDIVHGDSLSYSATLENGDELPKWLTFDATTRSFGGKAKGSDSYDILLTATDESGASVTQVFTLNTGDDHQHDDEHDHHAVRDTTQDEIISSSTVNDIIHTGNGADTIVFQRGDGQDTVYGGIGTDNTLVLGGINKSDIALSKNGSDLILETGNNDQITLRNWYDTSANYKSVLTLDIIASAVAEFDGQSGCGSNHHDDETSIDQFDFTAVVNAYDQACAAGATYQHWNATQSLSAAHIDDGEDSVLGSSAFKDVNISSLLAAGQVNLNLNTVQMNSRS